MPCLAATPIWTNIGPDGGDARILASDPRTDAAYVLIPRSGVFRRAPGGIWTLIFDAVARRVIPTRVAVDPQTSRVYVGTTTGLFRSDDAGLTWRTVATDSIVDVTASGDTVIISIPKEMRRSFDAGANWIRAESPPTDVDTVSLVRIDPRGRDRVLASVGGGLYQSDDSSSSWSLLLKKNIGAVSFGDAIYAAGPDGVYDCFSECERVGTDAVTELAYWRGIVYAAISDGVLRYERRWYALVEGFPDAQVLALAAQPAALLAGTTAGVYRSDDGNSWTRYNEGLTGVRITSIAASADTLVAATKGQSIMRRSAGTWTTGSSLPRDPAAARKVVTDGTTFYAAFGDLVFRSTDQGLKWVDVSSGLGSRDVFDVAADEGVVIAATLAGLARSTDRGTTWRKLTTYPTAWAGSVAVRGSMIVGGSVTTAAVSTDDGATWTSTELPSPIRQVAIAGNRAYAATDQEIFVRTDSGWINASIPAPASAARINAIASGGGRVYASVPSGIWFSDDGLAWTFVRGSESLRSDITSLAVDKAYLYAGTDGGSIFATLLVAPRQRAVNR